MIMRIEDDFDLDLIAESGQCFRWERLSPGSYRIPACGSCVYVEDLGDQRLSFSCDEAQFDAVWRDYFDLRENYAAIRERIDPEEDPFLWSAAQHEKGIRILQQDPWETLITFIISQNRNIPGICRSVELLCDACGDAKQDDRERAYRTFPDARAVFTLSEDELKACRLGYRYRYVHAAAQEVAEGRLDLHALLDVSEKELMDRLMQLPGVGIKVASCVSLFGFHNMNSFPEDVWMKRVLENEYSSNYPFEAYSPYNGVYQQYLFAHYRKTRSGE